MRIGIVALFSPCLVLGCDHPGPSPTDVARADDASPSSASGAASTTASAGPPASGAATASPPASGAPSASPSASASAAPTALEAVPGDDIAHGVVVRVCREQACTGALARITLLRDAEGRAGGLAFAGDIETCSHPPSVYLDHRGSPFHAVPERPVSREEAERIAANTKERLAPFAPAETVSCSAVLDGRWAPKADGRPPRRLPLPYGPGKRDASYLVGAYLTELHDCPPCPVSAQCKPCESWLRAISHPDHGTAEQLALHRESPSGVSPGREAKLVVNRWYAFVVEPREGGDRTRGIPVTLLAARPIPPQEP